MKPCESHRSRALKHQVKLRKSVFVPKCSEDGYYAPMQCTAKNKYCWCVDKEGKKKRGSSVKGLADCAKTKKKGKGTLSEFGQYSGYSFLLCAIIPLYFNFYSCVKMLSQCT